LRVPGSLKVRAGLLGERRDFRRLFLALLASSIGTWLAFVALVIDVSTGRGALPGSVPFSSPSSCRSW